MNVLEINEIGKFIRKKRKERSLRLEDLSDEQISTATISNIERGIPHVNQEKVTYLMKKMGIKMSDIPQLLEQDTENMESVQLRIIAMETMISTGNISQAQAALSRYYDGGFLPCEAVVHLLRGCCYVFMKEFRKAEREFGESIRLSSQDPLSGKINLEAMCYNYLARCHEQQEDWNAALSYVERGLQVFKKGDNQYDQIIHELKLGKVLYLKQLGRMDESFRVLDELWCNMSSIQNQELVLHMHAMRSELFSTLKLFNDAIRCAREGIQLAIRGGHSEETFRLWTILGKTYLGMNRLGDAETCFEFARDFSDRILESEQVVRIHIDLGDLYILQGKWDSARSSLKISLELSRKFGDSRSAHHALLSMGRLMEQMKRTSDAIQYFRDSVEVARKAELYDCLAKSYYELTNCFEKLELSEDYRQAVEQMYLAQKRYKEGASGASLEHQKREKKLGDSSWL
ncbi:helix-turn-helix domain-containing protein [Pasteuria penetrans]|uniref:helix-turn-helix domain-containing protein n=1 Tax=Pasteuria penetrans TaxID=86005 RepID=UPI000FA8DEC2|nr:helix-turn-helix transcriptional regulator [Pasteuria penetrans]